MNGCSRRFARLIVASDWQIVSMDLLDLDGLKRTPFIAQGEHSECALACLAMVSGFHGLKTDIINLRLRYKISGRGATLNQVMEIAESIGFNARPLRGDIEDLAHLSLPTILHWDLSHFVVLTKISRTVKGERFHIHDPAGGVRILQREELARRFTGVALDLVKSESFRPRIEQSKLQITHLWSSMEGIWSTLGTVLLLSLIMQAAVLVAPFYSQIAIDNAFPSADRDLLKILAVGFLMLAVVTTAANWLRSLVIVSLNNALSYQVIVNLFRHVVRLPIGWFERRHVGDVVSRFGSTAPISQLLSQGMVAAFVDGLMALLTLAFMWVYSPTLATIAMSAFVIYLCIRLMFLQSLRLKNIDAITTAARENSLFIETIRGISAIKSYGQEGNRQRLWQRAKADAINAQVKLGRLTAAFDALGAFVPAAERVLFIYVAVGLALDAKLTLGMIFAFQAYKQQFLDSGIRLVEQAVNYKVLQVHLGRLSDIVLSRPENLVGGPSSGVPNFDLPLTLSGVRFRYGAGDPEVLRGATLTINPGEMVAFVGPSGGGKTTLMRIMSGMADPTGGHILLGDRPLSSYSRQSWRRSIGIVSQDDVLFAGSLAENISFFDPQIDMEQVEAAATQACIHFDIVNFPLGYDTLVGDMGSLLSGGQKQRILLARALYARPKILFLDEGTANLDPRTEAAVIDSLKSLNITRIVVAHRTQSIAAADRVMIVAKGMVTLGVHPNDQLSDRDALGPAML